MQSVQVGSHEIGAQFASPTLNLLPGWTIFGVDPGVIEPGRDNKRPAYIRVGASLAPSSVRFYPHSQDRNGSRVRGIRPFQNAMTLRRRLRASQSSLFPRFEPRHESRHESLGSGKRLTCAIA